MGAQTPRENKMGVMPVNRLLITMSLPMMISMLVQALYNVVDSIFVSRIEERALTAVSLAFPVQNVMIAVAMGTCVGMNALVSKALGEKKYDFGNKVAVTTIFLQVCGFAVFFLFGFFFARPFYALQTSDEVIIEYGVQYLQTICMCSIGVYMQSTFEKMLQSTGKTIYTMITQGTGAVINIIMDPILIFGYFGFPEMGVRGAAVATVFGQCVAAVLAITINFRVNHEIHLSIKGFRPEGRIIKSIYKIGVPSIIMQAISGVMNFGMNQILLGFSSTATTVFGIYYKLQSFVFMPVFGLNNGTVPIVAYNYGAGRRSRVIKAIKLSCIYAVGIMLIGFALMQLIPGKLLLLFSASDSMLEIGIPALRTISISFIAAGYCIGMGSVFQALGCATYSMVNSVCRQVVVLLPVAWLFSKTGNLSLVWWSFPIAEVSSVILNTIFFIKVYRTLIVHIGENDA